MQHIKHCIDQLIENKTVGNIMVRVGRGDEILCDLKATAEARELTNRTLFDMASVTKIVAPTSLALLAMDRGLLSPDDSVSRFFSVPADKSALTVRHLLTHTMGIGHKSLLDAAPEREGIEEHILRIPSDIPIGTDVRYSCPGFILLGRILETIFDERLDRAFAEQVAAPLGMQSTCFLPDRNQDFVNANRAPDEAGLVNDYNCRHLGGVCGNAGLFSNLTDMTVYAKMLLAHGAPLISKATFTRAMQNETEGMSESRGLGFLYVDGRYAQTGGLFPVGSIGHCGHTGQSVFADPRSGLYVIILSDATVSTSKKYGRENYAEVMRMRHDVHAAIQADIEQKGNFNHELSDSSHSKSR